MDLDITKGAAILLSSLLSIFFGLLPLKILNCIRNAYFRNKHEGGRRKNLWSLTLCTLSCFAGGVFMGQCILVMLPELRLHFACVKRLLETNHPGKYDHLLSYPFSEFVISVGFFLVFFIEELILVGLKVCKRGETPKECGAKQKLTDLSLNSDEASIILLRDPKKWHDAQKRQRTISAQSNEDPLKSVFRPHPHSHVVRSLITLATLSFHTFLESMSYALRQKPQSVWKLFWTSSVHQAIVAFAVGTQLARTHRRQAAFVMICVCAFALCTPMGFLAGFSIVQNEQHVLKTELALMNLEGLAVGAFLYVTFFEVLLHERNNEHSSFMKLLNITAGCATVAIVCLFDRQNVAFGDEMHS